VWLCRAAALLGAEHRVQLGRCWWGRVSCWQALSWSRDGSLDAQVSAGTSEGFVAKQHEKIHLHSGGKL